MFLRGTLKGSTSQLVDRDRGHPELPSRLTLRRSQMTINISIEHQLLLCCAQLELFRSQRTRLEGLLTGESLSWQRVVQEARWHRLSAFLFWHLRDLDLQDLVPSEVMRELKRVYHENLSRNLFFRSDLREALDALRREGIPTIVLKGAALAEGVYQNIGLRAMGDIDLLVPHEMADKAFSTVQGIGYAPKESAERQKQRLTTHHHLAQLFGLGKPSIIEIHTHIVEPSNVMRFEISGFWDRAVETDIAGTRALTLSPGDLLIHLAIHFFKDRNSSSNTALGQLCDIARVARFYESRIDWRSLCRVISESGLSGPVYCAFYPAMMLLDAPIPVDVVEYLSPSASCVKDVERFIRRRVLGRDWMAKELIPPVSPYRWRAVPLAILGRIFPRDGLPASQNYVSVKSKGSFFPLLLLILQRSSKGLSAIAKLIANPARIYEDIVTDRWMHSLYLAGHDSKQNTTDPG